jgi:hypothetical protein
MPLSGEPGNLVAHPLGLITFYPIRLRERDRRRELKKLLRTPQ